MEALSLQDCLDSMQAVTGSRLARSEVYKED